MARNTQKYQYVDVGFLRGSELLARLLKDAESCGHSDHLGLHALTRLADYYRMIDSPVSQMATDVDQKPVAQLQLDDHSEVAFEEVEGASESEQMANADGAADFFGLL